MGLFAAAERSNMRKQEKGLRPRMGELAPKYTDEEAINERTGPDFKFGL